MPTCATCKSTILFGGVRDGTRRYCNPTCHGKDELVRIAQQIPGTTVHEAAEQIHRGPCPRCRGSGPVELHTSHRVWSMLVVTQSVDEPVVCCTRCANRRRLRAALFCALLGWWGFPWGLLLTPLQIARNLSGLRSSPQRVGHPSHELLQHVRMALAAQALPHHPRSRIAR